MPDRRGRRDLLRLVGGGVASGLAGCSAVDGPLWTETNTPRPVDAGGWRHQRGDPGRTGVNEGSPASGLDDSETVWISEGVPATPLLGTNGAFYLGTDDGTVLAVDPSSGDERWTTSLSAGCNSAALGPELLYVSTTDGAVVGLDAAGVRHRRIDLPTTEPTSVAVDGDTVFARDETGALYAMPTSLDEVDWSQEFASGRFPPVVGEDALLVRTGSTIHGLSTDGNRRWRVSFDGRPRLPAVADGSAYVARMDGVIEAIALDDGERRWSNRLPGDTVRAPAVGDHVYVVVSPPESAVLVAFGHDGVVEWETDLALEATSSPVVAGETVVVRGDGPVRGYDASSGTAIAEGRFGHDNYLTTGSPIAVDGRLAVVDPHFEGELHRIFST